VLPDEIWYKFILLHVSANNISDTFSNYLCQLTPLKGDKLEYVQGISWIYWALLSRYYKITWKNATVVLKWVLKNKQNVVPVIEYQLLTHY